MSKFTTPLKVQMHDDCKNWTLLEEFEYYRTDNPESKLIVPKGFVTDFASIPRIFRNILPVTGTKKNPYGKSAVLHDFLYDRTCVYCYSRKEADDIFLESMKAVGVSKFVSYLLYYSVRWFGKKHYSNTGSNK